MTTLLSWLQDSLMGAFSSSHIKTSRKANTTRDKGIAAMKTATGSSSAARSESFRRPSTIMVIDLEGRIKEFKRPIPASFVLLQNPNCYLCNSESMYLGTCLPRVPDDDELQPGQIYFLIPLSLSRQPLCLPLLCDLAIKASSALAR